MATGAVNATVTGTVYADNKLAVYQVDKVLVPLDMVLPKAKAPAPAKEVSPKSDKTKSSPPEESGDASKNADGGDAVPVDTASAVSVSFKAEIVMWVPLVLVVLGATV